MTWEFLLKQFVEMRNRAELETLSYILESEDKDAAYEEYLQLHADNEVLQEFILKTREMDEKLDKLLEKLG